MKPKDCNDGNLAEAVFEFARETHELHLELKRSNDNKAVLNRIAEMENRIMSVLSDYLTAQKAYNEQHVAAVAAITESVTGLTEDIQTLNDKITELQNSPGGVTPEDEATINELSTQGNDLVARTQALATALEALNQKTPPKVPPTPA